jgi:hypothetical protein
LPLSLILKLVRSISSSIDARSVVGDILLVCSLDAFLGLGLMIKGKGTAEACVKMDVLEDTEELGEEGGREACEDRGT